MVVRPLLRVLRQPARTVDGVTVELLPAAERELAGDVLYKRQLSTTTREMIWAGLPRGARRRRAGAHKPAA
jgi:hypothetical protein